MVVTCLIIFCNYLLNHKSYNFEKTNNKLLKFFTNKPRLLFNSLFLLIFILLILTILQWHVFHGLLIGRTISNNEYPEKILEIRKELKKLNIKFKNKGSCSVTAEIKDFFINSLKNKVFPAWYGTPYDFNGISRYPDSGGLLSYILRKDLKRKIACGHFVSAVLDNIGFHIDKRLRLGRQPASHIIRTFVKKSLIKAVVDYDFNKFLQIIKEMGFGIYIVGLDTHTGFILYDNSGMWLIHSHMRLWVLKEECSTSFSLKKSKFRMVGKISDDSETLLKWVRNIPFKISDYK